MGIEMDVRGSGTTLAQARAPVTLTSLPVETLQQILVDGELSKNDILRLRRTSRYMRDAVDGLTLPQFCLPTSLTLPVSQQRSTVQAYLQGRAVARGRSARGEQSRVHITANLRSTLIGEQPNVLFLRCGNGRLVLADFNNPACLFTEFDPAGWSNRSDKLLAMHRLRPDGRGWYIVAEGVYGGSRFISMFGNDGVRYQRELADAHQRPLTTGYPSRELFVFSASGQYLVHQCENAARRYLLDPKLGSVDCLAEARSRAVFSLCADTGRRYQWEADDNSVGHIRIFADATSSQALHDFVLEDGAGDCSALSVSPDGTRLAICAMFLRNGFSWGKGGGQYWKTYIIPRSGLQALVCTHAEYSGTDNLSYWHEREQVRRESFWLHDPLLGPIFRCTPFLQNVLHKRGYEKAYGLQDGAHLQTIHVARSYVGKNLVLISHLPLQGELQQPTASVVARWHRWGDAVCKSPDTVMRVDIALMSASVSCLFASAFLLGLADGHKNRYVAGGTLTALSFVLIGGMYCFRSRLERRNAAILEAGTLPPINLEHAALPTFTR